MGQAGRQVCWLSLQGKGANGTDGTDGEIASCVLARPDNNTHAWRSRATRRRHRRPEVNGYLGEWVRPAGMPVG